MNDAIAASFILGGFRAGADFSLRQCGTFLLFMVARFVLPGRAKRNEQQRILLFQEALSSFGE